MYVIAYDPSTNDVYLSRELADDEITDERHFAEEVADSLGLEIDDSDGYIPNCCGDIRVEFRKDPDNYVTIYSGESFFFEQE